MIVFDPLLLMAIILVSSGITGIPLSFAAFKKTDLGVVEKALIGFALGLLLPPLVSFLGVFTLNLKFGLSYGLAVHAIVAVAGIAFAYKERVWEEYKHFSPIPKLPKGQSFGDYFSFAAHFAPIALLFFVIATFLIRYQSFSPIYSEIDPYWYLYGAGQLLSQGTIPLKDNIVWYPLLETGHRAVPQLHHLWASWYSLYTGGGAFDTYMLSIIAGFYAPIFAAFTAFFAYLLFSREYGKSMGLLSAGLLSALPIFIQNTAGGQSQATAANFFGFLFFYASLALALKFKSTRFALLSCFALLSTILSTNVASAVTTTLFLFTIFQSVLLIFGKNKDDYMYFLKLS
ncbi:hypothetical protein FJZ26_04235, partial [Candidatus Parvarchaeota archaeon]|nr:hypothetical protein [Candidatus Parvarchaeota archaeon]